jgi:hypothetical protein
MTFIRNRRLVAALVATSCLAAPAWASADSLPATFKSDAAQSGGDPATPYSLPATFKSDAAQSGGDTPVDHPGASRAPTAVPTTIEIVRPERTIVRDVDDSLPLIMSSAALLLVLAGLGVTLIRTRMTRRPGHSH